MEPLSIQEVIGMNDDEVLSTQKAVESEFVTREPNYKRAKETANGFLEKYGEAIIFENVQVDITNLLDREGIRYAEEPFIGQNKSGYLMFDDIKNGKDPIIVVNEADSAPRKRFTLAHEFGHYALGHTENAGAFVFYREVYSDNKKKPAAEQEADCFASNLLMPPFLVQYVQQRFRYLRDEEYARMLGVSLAAWKYRLDNLRHAH